jgi:hypothetical protein
MGVLHRAKIEDVVVKRMLSVIINPNRYRSKAAEAFCKDILPKFASYTVESQRYEPASHVEAPKPVTPNPVNHRLVMPEID